MDDPLTDVTIRAATPADAERMQAIRAAAFAPVFASFRAILGDELYQIAYAHEVQAQATYLAGLLAPDSGWELYAAEHGGAIVGFVSLQLNHTTTVGEIGLNAVDPAWAGQGIGTAMYRFALDRMRAAGMRAATVSTGGDESHAPARRAYEKAGFATGIPSIWYCQPL